MAGELTAAQVARLTRCYVCGGMLRYDAQAAERYCVNPACDKYVPYRKEANHGETGTVAGSECGAAA